VYGACRGAWSALRGTRWPEGWERCSVGRQSCRRAFGGRCRRCKWCRRCSGARPVSLDRWVVMCFGPWDPSLCECCDSTQSRRPPCARPRAVAAARVKSVSVEPQGRPYVIAHIAWRCRVVAGERPSKPSRPSQPATNGGRSEASCLSLPSPGLDHCQRRVRLFTLRLTRAVQATKPR